MAVRHRRALIAITATLALAGGGFAIAREDDTVENPGPPAAATGEPTAAPGTTADPATAAAQATAPNPRVTRTAAVGDARTAVRRNAAAVKSAPGEKYQAVDAVVDQRGDRHVRFHRTHDGLPVLGGDFVIHSDATGRFAGATVAQEHVIDVPDTAKVSRKQALAVAGLGKGSEARKIVDAFNGKPALAWEVTGADKVVIVDATTGRIRLAYEIVHTAEKGSGQGLHVGDVELDTTRRDDGTYALIDPKRGGNTVRDALNGTHSTTIEAFAEFSDADNVWGDGTRADRASTAVDVLHGMAKTWDYLRDTFGRNGLRDNGKGVTAYVHHRTNYGNATWRRACECMLFGDGDIGEEPFTALDIVAHEMGHGLNQATAGLVNTGESGGLNEANSDIIGTLVEFYANGPADPPDYLIGEKLNVRDPALRRMDEPSLDGDSVSCWTPAAKNLDVHYSSGIGNKFFYNLAVGSGASQWGDSKPCGDAAPVTGIGNDRAAQIWYRAMNVYLVSNSDYAGARQATLLAAADLYGPESVERVTVDAAWRAAGVDGSQPAFGTPTLLPVPDATPSPRIGDAVSYQLAAKDPQGQRLTFSATNLPAGVTIDAASGLITGAPTTKGRYDSIVRVTDPDGNFAEREMWWIVKGPPVVLSAPAPLIMQLGPVTTVGIHYVTFVDSPDDWVDSSSSFTVTATGLPEGFKAFIHRNKSSAGTYVVEVSGVVVQGPASGTAVLTGTDADGDRATASFPWEIRAAGPPNAPVEATATGGNGTALLQWLPPTRQPGKLLPDGYIVRVSPGAETKVGADIRSFSLTGLDTRRTYTVGIRATSAAGDGPEKTVTLGPVGLPFAASPNAFTYGQASALSGRVTRTGGSAIAGVTVTVEQKPAGRTTWSRVTSVKTDAKGVWRATVKPSTTTAYRVVHTGSNGLWPATSGTAWTSVRHAVTAKASTTKPKVNKKIKISGTAKPGRSGVKITLQRKVGSRWVNVTTTTTNASGAYTFSRAFKRGTWNLRVLVAGNGYNATATSATVKLKVS
ncbi:M4 family metallopeptidase [Actinoplanes sp. NPDC023801]|uniref:M4 family metallopeptidase n=1 Tax=Actinoplanes sp. NPDC023801 TaxID=3154595 RepID=UPI0033ECCAB2